MTTDPDFSRHSSPDSERRIQHPPNIHLSKTETELLVQAIPGPQQIFVERELLAGFSGARVLLVRPSNLQTLVVKIGIPSALQQEWRAYRLFVVDQLPQNTARIEREPLFSTDGRLGLLIYSFAGGDPHRPSASLRRYFEEHDGVAAVDVLNRLIRVYGQRWWLQNFPRTFALSEIYDRLLPVHLELQFSQERRPKPDLVAGQLTLTASETSVSKLRSLHVGQRLRLVNFTVRKISATGLTLASPPPEKEASAVLRIRVIGIEAAAYNVGDKIPALSGSITATRQTLLLEALRDCPVEIKPTRIEVRPGQVVLPNPLEDYSALLDRIVDSRFSIIHGDLNLENILVEGDTGFAWLIDFADTDRGPAMYDLQRLEVQVITKLMPPLMEQYGLGPEMLVEIYRALHADVPTPTFPRPALQQPYILLVGIRRLARQFLMNDIDWDEYYQGLLLVLLGSLKFTDLGPAARTLAFTGAAIAKDLTGTSLREIQPHPVRKKFAGRWRLLLPLLGLLLLTVSVAAGWLWWENQPTSTDPPLAFVASFEGQVEIRRWNNRQLQSAVFGSTLFREDAVLTYEASTAVVLCENGLLFKLESGQVMVIRCQETADFQAVGRLDPQLSIQLLQASKPYSITEAPASTRVVRTAAGAGSTLLEPRNTAIVEPRPTWRWDRPAEVEGYRLTVVNALTGESWSTATKATEFSYPSDQPSLVPETTYLSRLQVTGNDDQIEESFFYLLDPTDRQMVAANADQILALSLDPVSTGYLLSTLYQQWELYGAAIEQLESITGENDPGLTTRLGDLYFQVGLYAKAEKSYEAALATARGVDDTLAEAGAEVGLGRVAQVYGETESVVQHFQMAETLYRTANKYAQAEAVGKILDILIERHQKIIPTVSRTP